MAALGMVKETLVFLMARSEGYLGSKIDQKTHPRNQNQVHRAATSFLAGETVVSAQMRTRVHDRPERHRLPCRGGGSQQPQSVSARRVGRPDAGGDGALDAHACLSCEEGDASGLGVCSSPSRLHHGGLQCAGPVAWFTTHRVGLRAPLYR